MKQWIQQKNGDNEEKNHRILKQGNSTQHKKEKGNRLSEK